LFYSPFLDITLVRIEIDADLHDWFATQNKSLVVIIQVDLLHRRLCILVHLHIYQINISAKEHHDVTPAVMLMNLHIHQTVG
jgi:hypothetical protein